MDFIDWCSDVLNKLIEAEAIPWDELYLWEDHISSDILAKVLFGKEFIYDARHLNKEAEERYVSMFWAIHELKQVGLVEMNLLEEKDTEEANLAEESILQNDLEENEEQNIVMVNGYLLNFPDDFGFGLEEPGYLPDYIRNFTCNVTEKGIRLAKDLLPLWREICGLELTEEQKVLLHYVNQYGPRSAPHHHWLEGVVFADNNDQTIPENLGAMRTLQRLGFVSPYYRNFYDPFFELRSTYKGLVWDTRRELVFKSEIINNLIKEWETTSVDFKQELFLDNADQKAEFIKDVLSLVNTQASGRRWLIIGFKDKDRAYFRPPNTRIT